MATNMQIELKDENFGEQVIPWQRLIRDMFQPNAHKPKPVIVVLLSGECRFRFAHEGWLVFDDIEQVYDYLNTARDNTNVPVSKIR